MTARHLLILAAALTSTAVAADATGTLTVNALVSPGCTIANATLDFGTVTSTFLAGTSTSTGTASTTVTVTCNALAAAYTFAFGNGQNYDAASATRRMKYTSGATSYYLPYTLVAVPAGIITALTSTIPIAGSISTTNTLQAGSYTDSVVMTFSY